MIVAQINEVSRIPDYVVGLLATEQRKVCTTMAAMLNLSHDKMYREMESGTVAIDHASDQLLTFAKEALRGKTKYLLFDDCVMSKQHAAQIEGVDVCFDSSQGHAIAGLQSVNVMLTDSVVRLPIHSQLFTGKQLGGATHKTKSELAAVITRELVSKLSIDRVIADAHYATKSFLHELHQLHTSFLMKIPSNRIVTIGNKNGQLKKLFRLKKNTKIAFISGIFDGLSCYFYAIKLPHGKISYLISNDYIDKKKIVDMYRIRWAIECFHRTAKQLLGLGECQMQSFEKQQLHIFYVMWAYSIAELINLNHAFSSTDATIRKLRDAKITPHNISILLTRQNSHAFA